MVAMEKRQWRIREWDKRGIEVERGMETEVNRGGGERERVNQTDRERFIVNGWTLPFRSNEEDMYQH